jgi:hypothetical protein
VPKTPIWTKAELSQQRSSSGGWWECCFVCWSRQSYLSRSSLCSSLIAATAQCSSLKSLLAEILFRELS